VASGLSPKLKTAFLYPARKFDRAADAPAP
jgi:hypothetical protein